MIQHLYIHIPFCTSLCPYCDFYTVVNNAELQNRYTDALLHELTFFKNRLNQPLKTIYFGGGTPSLLTEQNLNRIFAFLHKLKWAEDIEITFEANPATIENKKCQLYKDLGINRISLGTQSFVDSELKTLGRRHRKKDNYAAFELMRKAGFNNINLDLLIGTPGQNTESLQESLKELIKLSPEHLSPYILTYYEETVFTKMAASGRIVPADNDTEANLFDQAEELFTHHGYQRYEISNFAKENKFSRHNLNTWRFGEYLGVGCSAHSFFDLQRRGNPADLTAYLQLALTGEWLTDLPRLSRNDEISEYVMLALRTVDGLQLSDFWQRFKLDFTQLFELEYRKHTKNGLLISDDGRIFLSRKGMDLFNLVVADFMI